MADDRDLKKILSALKDAEGEARINVNGHAYFNGIRYIDHPNDCKCGRNGMLMRDHCWCCGYSELDSQCKCAPERHRGICSNCGNCPVHCQCKTKN